MTLRSLAVALLFWITVGLIQKFNWDLGWAKGLVLLAVLAALPFLISAARRATPVARSRALTIAAALLLLFQGGYALKELRHPSLIDAATTTLAAGAALRHGEDPYAMPLDSAGEALLGNPGFAGYKYLPLTLAAYLPLSGFGERGIILTNLLLHVAILALIYRLAAALGGGAAGMLALVLYLSLPMVPFQLFAKGDTDGIAILPMLAALLLVERNAFGAGLCLGLSLSAKLLPGAALLFCCLPARPRGRAAYAVGGAIGLVPALYFLAWSPQPFIDNIVTFNLLRPPDSTSWLFFAPPAAALAAHALAGLFYLGAAIWAWRHPPSLALRMGAGAMLILAAILAGPAAHHNYQLWWLPLAAALLGAALAPRGLPNRAAAV